MEAAFRAEAEAAVPSSSGQEVPLVSGQTALVEEGLGTEVDRQAYQKTAEEEEALEDNSSAEQREEL